MRIGKESRMKVILNQLLDIEGGETSKGAKRLRMLNDAQLEAIKPFLSEEARQYLPKSE